MSLLLHWASFIAKRPCYNLYPSQNLLWYVIEKVMEKCLFRHAIDCFCPLRVPFKRLDDSKDFKGKVPLVTFLNAGSQTQKQPSRGVFIKRCSENMQQIYRKTPMPNGDLHKSCPSAWMFSCKFSEYFFLRTPLDVYFYKYEIMKTFY